jgi:redox-sensitive bicupin YhaK (pirin superfamily)
MMQIRHAAERGRTSIAWLDSRHSFSFADYQDPNHMAFRSLRVINEDRVKAAQGFGTHGHRDMEILTYVLEGAIEHRDNTGSVSILNPGELQRMSAGTGIRHSEYNASKTDPVHFYQIWLLPERRGITPGYEQKSFADNAKDNRFLLVSSPDARDGSLRIHQDADIYLARLSEGATVSHPLRPGRHAWLQVLRGNVRVNGQAVSSGDGVALSEERTVEVQAAQRAEVILFDLA